MAGNAKVANAIVTIIPTMDGARSAISDAVTDGIAGTGGDAGGILGTGLLDGLNGKLGAKLGPLVAGLFSTAAVTAVGKALMDIGAQFDEMTDNIIVGTGATGDALAGLEESARAVATSLPVSFSDAGQTVADLNTRLGLTGDSLTELSKKVAALDSFTGQATDINTMTGAMAAFGVNAEDVSDKLDYFWGVSQATGVSMNQLFSTLETNAPALTSLGFSLEESANMVGLLDKAGIDAGGTMSSLSKALVNLAEPGQDTADAFNDVLIELQSLIDAGDEAAALDLASGVFGTRAATKFVAAVQSGALSLDALGDAALGAGGDIMGTMDATMSWPERFEVIKNQLMEMIEPLASALFEGLGGAMEAVSASLASIDTETMRQIGESLGNAVATVVPVIVDFVANTLPGLLDGFGMVVSVVGQLLPMVPALGIAFATIAAGPVGTIIGSIGALVTLIGTLLVTNEEFRDNVVSLWEGIKSFFSGVPSAIAGFFAGLPAEIGGLFASAYDAISGVGESIVNYWSGIPRRILNFFSNIGGMISNLFANIKLPHFKLHGSINPLNWPEQGLPGISVEWYGTGGVAYGPEVVGVGEAGPEAILPLSPDKLAPVGEAVADSLESDTLGEILATLQDIRENGRVIVMDSGALVGATIGATDAGLGARQNWTSRGVAVV